MIIKSDFQPWMRKGPFCKSILPKQARLDSQSTCLLENDVEELNRAVNLLSISGTLVVLNPSYQWLLSEFDKTIGHFRRYAKKTLTAVISPELEPVFIIQYLDFVGVIASLANRVLLHKSTPSAKQIDFWDKIFIPCSRVIDPLIFHSFGKSVIGIRRKNNDIII